jgi:hypothetical protein
VGARFSAPVQAGPGVHPASCIMGTGSFPGGKERPGRDADPSPPSSAVVIEGSSYTSTPPVGLTVCTEPQCLYKGALYLFYLEIMSRLTDVGMFADGLFIYIRLKLGHCSHLHLLIYNCVNSVILLIARYASQK